MNESTILEELGKALKAILGAIAGVAILSCFVALLFAPAFGNMIEDQMMRGSNGGYVRLTQMPEVARQMVWVRLLLWSICLATWTFFILVNLLWKYGN